MAALSFGLLGPLAVVRDGQRVAVNTGKLRVVLAALLVRANQTVSTEELVERLWGEEAPSTARKTVQVYLMRLRRTLGDDTQEQPLVQTRPNGYLIELEPHQLDLAQFYRLRDESTVAARAGDLGTESARLSEGLGLWRGRALEDVPSESLQREVVPQLEEMRLAVTERRVQLDLELGRHREAISELVQLTKDHPWHEQFWIQLILALYRSDRLADALDTCRTMQQLYRTELGIDPGEQFQQLHRMLLAGSLTASSVATVAAEEPELAPFAAAISQLPPPVRRFVGRTDLVEQLSGLLIAGADTDAVPIVNVSGPPGMGKTALALHVAHRLRGHFADGQLYVNLRGYTADPPLRPTTALTRFLRALGVPLGHIPGDPEGQAALYRSMLAGRRVLVLLDDAANPDQVRALLPGQPGCVVLVTSRNDLRGLAATQGVDHLPLPALSAEDSAEVLADLIGAKRASAEPDAVAALARTCAYLPLALRIAGANLAADPHASIAEYVRDLAESGALTRLAVAGDERAGVRAAIDLSYDRLSPADRRLFRQLSLAFGADVTAPAAAALGELTLADATSALDQLTAVNLLHRHAPGRFQFHDLIREYATDRARVEDTHDDFASALDRLMGFYLHIADQATRRLYPGVPRLPLPMPPEPNPTIVLDTDSAALRWLDAERFNLFAAVTRAANCPEHAHNSWQLIDVLRGYVQSRGHAVEALAACEAALQAAERAGDHRAQASVLDIVGLISYNMSDYERAIDNHTRALEQARLAGDLDAECHSLHNLGRAHTQLGQPKLAGRCHTKVLAISRKTGNREVEALALHYIGVAHLSFGQPRSAIEWHRQALAVSGEIGNRQSGYRALNGIGIASWALGLLDDATKYHEEVLGYCQELGLGLGEAISLVCLAETNCDAGRFELAAEQAREAINRSLEIGERRTEAGGLEIIATVRQRRGQHQAAVEGYTEALRLAEEIGFAYGKASTLIGLATAHRCLGAPELAAQLCGEVLTTMSGSGMGILEAAALTELAHSRLRLGELDTAATAIGWAVETARRRGQRLVEARALQVLGLVQQRIDGTGSQHWQAALGIFTDLGTPEADEVRALL